MCVHNSARSQMAEAFINHYYGDRFEAESAGLEKGKLNPLAVRAMQEIGINISGKQTNLVSDYLKEGRSYAYVITVCDEASAERCPVFPGDANRIHWNFPDPSQFKGTEEEKLEQIRKVRDDIKDKIAQWAKDK